MPQDNFKTTIRGGAWAQQNKGVPFDSTLAYASGALAVRWCKDYHMPVRATFALKKFGDNVAPALALYWYKRLQHLYNLHAFTVGYELHRR